MAELASSFKNHFGKILTVLCLIALLAFGIFAISSYSLEASHLQKTFNGFTAEDWQNIEASLPDGCIANTPIAFANGEIMHSVTCTVWLRSLRFESLI